ncbi:diguanylate cyclase [Aliarcobacter lanthieri]|uniref:GGDEF domain-containing protein n=1 Tax=Aliarcobacter lanthieri TaxID=1355374 RepID=UPI001923B826|nr:GGDEF domain-containing protein [Aliarcobacter lanthieri]MBL3520973.1 diguanylate cyclase [Aliarcobacter lanthieri]
MKNFLSQLNDIEYNEAIENKIDSLEKIIQLLLKRVHPHNVEVIVDILKQSITPSISQDNDNNIDILFDELKNNPNLIFEKNIQIKIEKLIIQRFEKDKKLVIQKTEDISKLVLLMEEYFNEAIFSSGNGTKKVLNIKEKIQAIDLRNGGVGVLEKLQNELVLAATSIEQEMTNVTNKLESGKSKIEELEEKINSLENELSRTKAENRKDFLTQILTRKAFNEEVIKIESSYSRLQTQYAVVFFDIDHFKNINDTYGHEGGDVVLSTFGKILDKSIRDHDLVGRYGGEEFIAVVHFNLDRELLMFLKRIKSVVTENSFIYKDKKIKLTFSAGVAIRNKYPTYENTVQKADSLLYRAKQSGRNKILLDNGIEI